MHALTHAIEGYTTLGAWELTDALHLKAIKIIATSLPGSARGDDSTGERMALGQYIAGMASPTSDWVSCTRWPTRSGVLRRRAPAWPTRSCCAT